MCMHAHETNDTAPSKSHKVSMDLSPALVPSYNVISNVPHPQSLTIADSGHKIVQHLLSVLLELANIN
jgi:hypothetical protein